MELKIALYNKLFFTLKKYFLRLPKTQEELLDILEEACAKRVIDNNTLNRIKGILDVHTLRAKEIMIPRAQMCTLSMDSTLTEILPTVIETAHSRFPVVGEDLDEIKGILLAKDLLPFTQIQKPPFHLSNILREATFIPENKKLDILLQEFRLNRNHMAIVVNEYGGVSGLVTIEDVLEQIVGNIEDEYDYESETETYITPQGKNAYSIKALTPLATFNEHFQVNFSLEDVETIGGFVTRHFNHLPKRGEEIQIENFQFKILRANNRKIQLLQMVQRSGF